MVIRISLPLLSPPGRTGPARAVRPTCHLQQQQNRRDPAPMQLHRPSARRWKTGSGPRLDRRLRPLDRSQHCTRDLLARFAGHIRPHAAPSGRIRRSETRHHCKRAERLNNLRAPRSARLPKPKPMIIKIKPADSHYERGNAGGHVKREIGLKLTRASRRNFVKWMCPQSLV